MAILVQYLYDEGTGTNVNDSGTSGIDLTITASGTSAWEADGDGTGYAVNDEDSALISSGDIVDGTALATAYGGGSTAFYCECMSNIDAQNARRQVLFACGSNIRVANLFFLTTTESLNAFAMYAALGSTSGEVPDTYRIMETEGDTDDLVGRHLFQGRWDTTQVTEGDREDVWIDGVVATSIFVVAQDAEFTLPADSYIDMGSWHTGTSSGSLNQVAGAIRFGAIGDGSETDQDIEDRAAALLLDDDVDPEGGAPAAPAATPQFGLAFTGGMGMGF